MTKEDEEEEVRPSLDARLESMVLMLTIDLILKDLQGFSTQEPELAEYIGKYNEKGHFFVA